MRSDTKSERHIFYSEHCPLPAAPLPPGKALAIKMAVPWYKSLELRVHNALRLQRSHHQNSPNSLLGALFTELQCYELKC